MREQTVNWSPSGYSHRRGHRHRREIELFGLRISEKQSAYNRVESSTWAPFSFPDVLDCLVINEVVTGGIKITSRSPANWRPQGYSRRHLLRRATPATLEIGKQPRTASRTIVVVIPSFAERYLSTAPFDGL